MERAFWAERWAEGKTAFHEGAPNALLHRNASLFDGKQRVLVPLSGKSHDLWYLAARGLEVTGIEFVDVAARAFFDEAGEPYRTEPRGPYQALVAEAQGGRITQLVGDMFDAAPNVVGTFDALYDRAALIALDPPSRRRYVDVLQALLAPGAGGLLVTLTYDQSVAPGPPWSVSDDEVHALFDGAFQMDVLDVRPTQDNARLQAAGAKCVETAWQLTRRP